MSLENFQIPIILIPELYKDSLVQLDATQPSSQKIEETELNFLGKNRKNILILVNESGAVHLNDANMELLTNILNACKLSMNDVCLLNVNTQKSMAVSVLTAKLNAACLLIFGNMPTSVQLPANLNPYENTVHMNCKSLLVDELKKIASEPELKKKLWKELKILFDL
jgi:hypothetical protein